MKYLKIVGILFVSVLAFISCEDTNDNLVQQRGVYSLSGFTEINNTTIDYTDIENGSVSFNVELDGGSTDPDAIFLELTINDSETVELAKITDYPSEFDFSVSDIAEAFGTVLDSIKETDYFTFSLIQMYGDDSLVNPSTTDLTITFICPYNYELATGSYHEYSADWAVEGDVTMTVDENDPNTIYIHGIGIVEGLTNHTGNTVELTIDPTTYEVTGGSTLIANDLSDWGLSYTNYTFTVASGSVFSPCDGTYTIYFTITVDQGSWGDNEFIFTRN